MKNCRGDSRIARRFRPFEREHKRREQAPALLYYNRHFPYQGNHPRPTLILYFVRSKNTPTNPNLCIKMHTEKISVCAFGYILFNLRRFALTATLPRRCPYRLQHRDETAKSTRDNSARPARQSSLSSRRLSHCRWRSAQSFSPA